MCPLPDGQQLKEGFTGYGRYPLSFIHEPNPISFSILGAFVAYNVTLVVDQVDFSSSKASSCHWYWASEPGYTTTVTVSEDLVQHQFASYYIQTSLMVR